MCLSALTNIILSHFQGSYGVVKLAYNEDDDKYYVSALKHLLSVLAKLRPLFLSGLPHGMFAKGSGKDIG